MANYPNAIPSFSDKSPGQTIASAHMDAVQDEIVAIGSGLLQGTAPLNSSNSTLANLSVTGGSTIALSLAVGVNASVLGALSVGGNSTIAGTLSAGNISVAAGQIVTNTFFTNAYNMNNTNMTISNVPTVSSGNAGAAEALPATPAGYLRVTINGSTRVIPFYALT